MTASAGARGRTACGRSAGMMSSFWMNLRPSANGWRSPHGADAVRAQTVLDDRGDRRSTHVMIETHSISKLKTVTILTRSMSDPSTASSLKRRLARASARPGVPSTRTVTPSNSLTSAAKLRSTSTADAHAGTAAPAAAAMSAAMRQPGPGFTQREMAAAHALRRALRSSRTSRRPRTTTPMESRPQQRRQRPKRTGRRTPPRRGPQAPAGRSQVSSGSSVSPRTRSVVSDPERRGVEHAGFVRARPEDPRGAPGVRPLVGADEELVVLATHEPADGADRRRRRSATTSRQAKRSSQSVRGEAMTPSLPRSGRRR